MNHTGDNPFARYAHRRQPGVDCNPTSTTHNRKRERTPPPPAATIVMVDSDSTDDERCSSASGGGGRPGRVATMDALWQGPPLQKHSHNVPPPPLERNLNIHEPWQERVPAATCSRHSPLPTHQPTATATVFAHPPPFPSTAPPQPVAPPTSGNRMARLLCDDDDDDDLSTLGGYDAARSASTSAAGSSAVSPTAPYPPLQLTTSHQNPPVSATTPRDVSSFPWHSRLSATRREIMGFFQAQFAFGLAHDDSLRCAFRPFARDKTLSKIVSSAPPSPVLPPAPRVPTERPTSMVQQGLALRGYQITGVQFLLDGFHRGLSMILGDDMGLGKTAQVASFLNCLHTLHGISGPHLLLVPMTTLSSWVRELSRWAPSLHTVKYHGNATARRALQGERHNRLHVFVTTSQTFVSDRAFFRNRAWVTVVVDEAHILKGDKTMINTQVRKLDACCRIAVTGTPVHNRTQEVWNLMGFLYPNIGVDYCSPDHSDDPIRDCAALLRQIMLRRTKDTLDLGVPPRVDVPVLMVAATWMQQTLFDFVATAALLADNHHPVDDGDEGPTESSAAASATAVRGPSSHARSGATKAIFVFLTRQRHICNHPLTLRLLLERRQNRGTPYVALGKSVALERLRVCSIPIDEAHIVRPSAKMVQLDDMLKHLFTDGHRVLIFANFTTTLDLIEAMCVLRGYHYDRLDGESARVDRELSMVRFNNPASRVFVFLVTTAAGGVGVTLTGADTVILFDAHYNPQIDRQAADRAHRIGQTKTVRVYRLCVKDSVEEHIQRIARQKAELGDTIVSGLGTSGGGDEGEGGSSGTGGREAQKFLSADEVRRMFAATATSAQNRNPSQHHHDGGGGSQPHASQQEKQEASENEQLNIAMLEDLVRVAELDDDSSDGGGALARGGGGGGSGFVSLPHTHVCFECGLKMKPLEPLLHCAMCTKAYHKDCLPEGMPVPTANSKLRTWSCPRHTCADCGKDQATDGALFLCIACPTALCFDCLDPRYFALSDDGLAFSNISHEYPGIEEEGMPVRKALFYITCLRCSGLDDSPSASSNEDNGSSGGGSTDADGDDDVTLLS